MSGVLTLGRIVVAAVFLVAGAAKLRDLPGTRRVVAEFGVPRRAAAVLGTLLPVAELVAGGALLAGPTAAWGALGALALLLLFSVAIAWNLIGGRAPECRCFGQLHSAPVGGRTLARNLAVALIAFLVAATHGALAPALAVVGVAALAATPLIARLRQARLKRASDGRGDGPTETVPEATAGRPLGTPAPPFRLRGEGGVIHTLDSLGAGGQPILLLFTDVNCGPCIELAPDVARWQRECFDQLTIAVIEQQAGGVAPAEGDEFGRRNVVRQPDSQLSDLYGVLGTPSAVLVGADRTIASPAAAGGHEIEGLLARTVEGFERRLPTTAPARPGRGPFRRRELLVRAAGAWTMTGFVLAWPARAAVELRRGQKPCPKPWHLRCDGKCYAVLIDRDHCGTNCGNLKRCKSGIRRRQVCAGGKCIADTDGQFPCNVARPTHREKRGLGGETPHQCPGDQICCQGNCVDPTRSPNCGACGQLPPGRRPACCQGAPRDLSRDPRHCGACFNRCPQDKPLCYAPSGTSPSAGCRATCGPKLRSCGTKDCFDPKKEVCCEGKVLPKEGGLRQCGKRCVDVSSDPKNCGKCDLKCSGPFDTGECCNGNCCDYNAQTCCPGGCTNTGLDELNCGACGNVCKPGEFCRFGECVCPLGQTCG